MADNIETVAVKGWAWDIATDIYFPPGIDSRR